METEHFDVIVVGAGISGIGAGYHLQKRCPDRSYAILEGRPAIGGTWDLFRYPGIRSDSDMYTLGYGFEPWTKETAIADGTSIRQYLDATMRKHGIDRHLQLQHRLKAADWSTPDARWTLSIERGPEREPVRFTCNFLYMCTGYYDYARGYAPAFAGAEAFAGQIVHPQFWPGDLAYAGKRVVVIGSGATAVTLVPNLAAHATHVTMLQRSPSYVVALPSRNRLAKTLRRVLPSRAAHGITRAVQILVSQLFYRLARRRPAQVKARLIDMARKQLPAGYDVETHFTPSYNPWDQRLCVVPDADLFQAIREGRASVETGHVEAFTRTGIRLTDGRELPADVIVTATGLELQLLGGVPLTLDGVGVDPTQATNYKGLMLSDIPNLAFSFGYTNASWTLRADLTARYVCRLLNTMRARGMRQGTPRISGGALAEAPLIEFTSGYVQRGIGRLPKQGTRDPWRATQSYARDLVVLRFGRVDAEMELGNPEVARAG